MTHANPVLLLVTRETALVDAISRYVALPDGWVCATTAQPEEEAVRTAGFLLWDDTVEATHLPDAPCIMLGALPPAWADKGIAHYKKPFRLHALLQQLKIEIASAHSAASRLCRIGKNGILRMGARTLTHAGSLSDISLTQKEAELLFYLTTKKPQAVPRDELLSTLWGYKSNATSHTLETHLYRLRQKLKQIQLDDVVITVNDGLYCLEDMT